MEDKDSTNDAFPLSGEQFRESYGVPRQDSYICRACGETAYPPVDNIDTFDPEAAHIQHLNDDEQIIVCWGCLQTDDWEQRARERDAASTTDWFQAVDRLADSWIGRLLSTLRTRIYRRAGQDVSESRMDPPDVTPDAQDASETDQLSREKLVRQLEQEREWASYLERELHATEDELTAVQEELRQLRQQPASDGTAEPEAMRARDAGVDPTALFDVREALGNAIVATNDAPVRDGLIRVDQQLIDALGTVGIEEIDTTGEANPHQHEVIETMPTADQPPGTILKQYQAGYRRGGEVLRPAQVAVATDPEDDAGTGPREGSAGDGSR